MDFVTNRFHSAQKSKMMNLLKIRQKLQNIMISSDIDKMPTMQWQSEDDCHHNHQQKWPPPQKTFTWHFDLLEVYFKHRTTSKDCDLASFVPWKVYSQLRHKVRFSTKYFPPGTKVENLNWKLRGSGGRIQLLDFICIYLYIFLHILLLETPCPFVGWSRFLQPI